MMIDIIYNLAVLSVWTIWSSNLVYILIFTDNAKLQFELFKKFIPGFMISTLPCQLSYLSSEAREMSENLRNTQNVQR